MKNFLFLLILLIPTRGVAQKTIGGDQIEVTEVVNQDLYITGGTVTVNAPVHGDLVIAGGTVVINDTITGDIIAIGGKITTNSYIGDDLRGVGGEIYLNDQVQGDVVLSGGTVTMARSSIVHGDMLLATGSAILAGTVRGNLKCRIGTINFSGEVKQDADCRGGTAIMNGIIRGKSTLAASDIKISNGAAFYDNVSFWQNKPVLNFGQSMKQGKAVFDPALEIDNGKWQYLGFKSLLILAWYLGAIFVVIYVIQYLFSNVMQQAAEEISTKPTRSIGYGLLFLVAVPVAVLALLITLVGIPVGILLLFGYMILLMLASVITSVVIANWIGKRYKWRMGLGQIALTGLGVFVPLKLVSLVPVLGWLLLIVLYTLAFGSIIAYIYRRQARPVRTL